MFLCAVAVSMVVLSTVAFAVNAFAQGLAGRPFEVWSLAVLKKGGSVPKKDTFTPIQQEVLQELFNEGVNQSSNTLASMLGDAEILVSTPLPRNASIWKILSHKSSSELRASITTLTGGICGNILITYPYEEMVPVYFEMQRKQKARASIKDMEAIFLKEISETISANFVDSLTLSLDLPSVVSHTEVFMDADDVLGNSDPIVGANERYCLCARMSVSDAEKSVIFYALFNEQSLFLAQALTKFMKSVLRPAVG